MKQILAIAPIILMVLSSSAASADGMVVCDKAIAGIDFKQADHEVRKIVESQVPYTVNASHEARADLAETRPIANSIEPTERLQARSLQADGGTTPSFHRGKNYASTNFVNYVNVDTHKTPAWSLPDAAYQEYLKEQWALHCNDGSIHKHTGSARQASYTLENGDYLGVRYDKIGLQISQRSQRRDLNRYSCQYHLRFPSGEAHAGDAPWNRLTQELHSTQEQLLVKAATGIDTLSLNFVSARPSLESTDQVKSMGGRGSRLVRRQ